jgi:hypothetical protein
MVGLKRKYNGKTYKLIAANRASTTPFSRKADAKAKAKFYKRNKVLKSVIVAKVKGGYVLYGR